MKVQQTLGEKYGKKFGKLAEAVTALDNQIIVLGDSCEPQASVSPFAKEYKTFAKLAAKLAALVGE
jgi:hypothetical protein